MKSSRVVFAVLTLFLGMSSSFADGHLAASTTNSEAVYYFSDASDAGGLSHLTRTNGMIVATVEAANLVPGHVHTLWVLVFNKPGNCSDDSCGEDDIFNEDGTLNGNQVIEVGLGIANGSGNVAKADGTLEFGARIPRGADLTTLGHQVLFGDGFGPIVLTASPHEAEVHFIIQTHGQARGGPKLLETLNLEGSNCTPFCSDIQFAVHLP
jgi:hypothetical protein